jgi:hypothetical protein
MNRNVTYTALYTQHIPCISLSNFCCIEKNNKGVRKTVSDPMKGVRNVSEIQLRFLHIFPKERLFLTPLTLQNNHHIIFFKFSFQLFHFSFLTT